ncbi:hypothetical protein ILUMI_22317 [Ignelater luminosus]|uniref:RING-type domain-containing protein n=1 Tax=Ignelater luminosus TaxID=2038154 RepID=A0A8K0CG13_IGNLU|nr:hypothetical protein ILUMI_22317 [Ignelater luminosus]
MPCTKCRADFNLITWKIKCIDCEQYHCSKCLRKMQGSLFCEKCLILNKRPPDRERLMELRSKDLRDYLNKNKISTHGLVEKAELVELFYRCTIPVRSRRSNKGLSSVFTGSVPNLASQSQDHINNLRTNIESNINNVRSYAENALHNLGSRVGPNLPNHSQHDDSENPQFSSNVQQNSYFYTTFNNSQPTSSSSSHDIPNQQEAPSHETTSASSSPPHKYPKLSDFATAEELNELSVKQLKELLTLNRVDYKGCVEKSELLDRATRLWNDSNQYKNEDLEEASVDNLCKICMDAPLDCVILECGHMATCVNCGKRLAECPICRQYVTRVVRTFKA